MKKNIIITGGELFNKGAQSMTFTVVDEMKKRFPDKEIYLLSSRDYRRPEEEKSKYNFNIFPEWDMRIQLRENYPFTKLLIRNKNYSSNIELSLKKILNKTLFAIDISGYHLSSQFPNRRNLRYFFRIKLLKMYNIPFYIFPQSIGPFDYKFPYNLFFNRIIKKTLEYPKVIYPREFHGFNLLNDIGLNNIQKNVDTVFYQNNIDKNNIFVNDWKPEIPEIKDNSVAIVPNSKLNSHNMGNNIDVMYEKIINYLLERNKNIYIFRHSTEDFDLCRKIYKLANGHKKVHLLEDDFNAIELYSILNNFEYIIASRYHSIVHSYKNTVPALIIGWAVKYKELSKLFEQEDYVFDIRKSINFKNIILKLDKLNNSYKDESYLIAKKLTSIKENNIFDIIKE